MIAIPTGGKRECPTSRKGEEKSLDVYKRMERERGRGGTEDGSLSRGGNGRLSKKRALEPQDKKDNPKQSEGGEGGKKTRFHVGRRFSEAKN